MSRRAQIVAVLILAAALRIAYLDSQPLWFDELYTEFVTRGAFGDMFARVPPFWSLLYPGAIWLTRQILPAIEFVLRWPAMLASLIAVAGVYAAGKQAFGHRVGLIAALLMAVSMFFIRYSQEARSYGFLMAGTAVSLWLWLRLRRRDDLPPGLTALYAVVAFLTMASHFIGAGVIAVQAGLSLLGARRPVRLLALHVGVIALYAVLYAGQALYTLENTFTIEWVADRAAFDGLLAESFEYVSLAFSSRIGAVAALALIGVAVVTAPAFRRRETGLIVLWWLAPFVGLFALSIALRPVIVPRYLLATMPGIFLLTALAIDHLPRGRWLAAGGLVAFLLVNLIAGHRYYQQPIRTQLPDSLAVVQQALEATPDADWVMVGGFTYEVHQYYVPPVLDPPALYRGIDPGLQALGPQIDQVLDEQQPRQVWLISVLTGTDYAALDAHTRHDLTLIHQSTYYETQVFGFSTEQP